MKKFKFLVFVTSIVLLAAFGREASAVYYTSGTLTSTNLLSGKSVGSIDSFWYNASSIPSGTALKVQFSRDNTNWYNSSGTPNGWNDCTTTGGATIPLSGLGWTGANFYYKMEFGSTGGTATPVLEAIRVDYSLPCTNTAPSVTTLSSPSNGATGQSTSPTVSWNAVASWGVNCAGNTNTYRVFLDTNLNPITNRGTVAEGQPTSLLISGLSNNTTYYWKVRARNGALTSDSAVWSFTTVALPYLNVSPTTVNLSATQGTGTITCGGSGQGSCPSVWKSGGGTLSWTTSPSSPDGWLSWTPASDGNGPTTLWVSATINGLAAGSYSGAITVTGAAGTQNSPQTITVNLTVNAACTNTAPSVPTLSLPATGATGQSTSPTVSWNTVSSWGINCAGNTNTYQVFLDTNSNPTTSRGTVAEGITSKSISGLSNNTTYYWKVRANNGSLSTDSAIPNWSFTTAPSSPYVLDKTMCDDSSGSGGGVVSAQSISSPSTTAAISARSWVVTGYDGVYFSTYLELQTIYGYNDPTTSPIAADPPTTDLSEITSSGIYRIERDFTLASSPCTLPGSPAAVVFVNGDLIINTNFGTTAIDLGDDPLGYRNGCDSSLAFIVSGDITIAPTVNNIYGIFYAGGDVGMSTETSPNPLYVFGSLLAHDFDLNRNLGADNSTYPAEQVIFMPKYFVTLKDVLGRSQVSWKEVKSP